MTTPEAVCVDKREGDTTTVGHHYRLGVKAAQNGEPRVPPDVGWCNPESSDMTKSIPYPGQWDVDAWKEGWDAVANA